ncbi:hypothetical protein B0O99DRAFT_641275 [Bisporella sp. PMI_857]|nr:hypothetical protein B0O99DRAFT_641275 [Bisporella sp. PMI_857]
MNEVNANLELGKNSPAAQTHAIPVSSSAIQARNTSTDPITLTNSISNSIRKFHMVAASDLRKTPPKKADHLFIALLPPHKQPSTCVAEDFLWLEGNMQICIDTVMEWFRRETGFAAWLRYGDQYLSGDIPLHTLNHFQDDLVILWAELLRGGPSSQLPLNQENASDLMKLISTKANLPLFRQKQHITSFPDQTFELLLTDAITNKNAPPSQLGPHHLSWEKFVLSVKAAIYPSFDLYDFEIGYIAIHTRRATRINSVKCLWNMLSEHLPLQPDIPPINIYIYSPCDGRRARLVKECRRSALGYV